MTAASYTQRQAGRRVSLVQFSWPPSEAVSRCCRGSRSQPSLRGVRVTGVQAGLCGCAAVVGSWRAVEGLCAPPQVLQGLKEGAARPLLLQG